MNRATPSFDFPMLLAASIVALTIWCVLAIGHGAFWVPLLPRDAREPTSWPSVDIIVPARNEAEVLPIALSSLLQQNYPGAWRVLLADDHSTDGTGKLATDIAAQLGKIEKLSVITVADLPQGWSGKVAAMNTGVAQSKAEMILFTDADIRHNSDSLHKLVTRAQTHNIDLVSRMVMLNCQTFAEKLLIPAFVFFFAMLYPFRHVNNPDSRVAAAAGGTMLVHRTMLDKIGGLASIKSALIDDCSLARAVKNAGGRIELTLTRDIESLRIYEHPEDIWKMVARTAYTQLRLSPWLLIGTILGMALIYLLPIYLFLFAETAKTLLLGTVTYAVMVFVYAPTVLFYRQPIVWALTLPVAALIYALATIDSARLYYLGKGGQWKGRTQA